jgi:hypothetical protein
VTALGDAVAGRLVGWQGLSGGLDEAALRSELAAEFTRDPTPRPRAARGYVVLHGRRATPPEQVDAWFPLGADEAATVEFEPPGDLDAEALLGDLGDPDLVLDSRHFEAGAVVEDHVHAGRGITIAVAQPFEPGPRRVVHVQLYAATTPERYVSDVGQSGEELRPYPRSD